MTSVAVVPIIELSGHEAMHEYANWLARLVGATELGDAFEVKLAAEKLKALYANALIVKFDTIDKKGE